MSKTNRLSDETSPYLLQHAHNPVDWYPWGDEAFAKARREEKPIFLSIGYSACHWCHVMERESFEDEAVAAILNEHFVSVKVDREERPDVDSVYMQAVQMMTGHGGWPMSVFLRPDGAPFYAGTYFPPDDRHGLPSFRRVVTQLASLWNEQRGQVEEAGDEIRRMLRSAMDVGGGEAEISAASLEEAAAKIASGFDHVHGGFGTAPKFPPAMSLDFLMQVAARSGSEELAHVVRFTMGAMARGGLYDQVGGGFHRYSVDARWLVPHFEKMLYDNALLARLYVRGWQWSGDPEHERIARETLGFVMREMTSPDGAFYATLDADSEGVEGKFYVWSRDEVMEVLGEEEGRAFSALYDITAHGNWEGNNIPNMPRSPDDVAGDLGMVPSELADIASRGKCRLYGRREERVRPGRDEKVLAGWNGWMLAAFAEAALAFDDARYRDVVRANADFLVGQMIGDDGRLWRSWKDGTRKIAGLLEDYAGVAWGLLAAFDVLQEKRYLDAAAGLADAMLERFGDERNGGFFDTPADGEELIARPKDVMDNATPSGNSLATAVLLRLALLLADERYERKGRETLRSLAPIAMKYPNGFGFLLGAAEWVAGEPHEIVIRGAADDATLQEMLRVVGRSYLPNRVLLVGDDAAELPLNEDKPKGEARAWLCRGYRCLEPARSVDELASQLGLRDGS